MSVFVNEQVTARKAAQSSGAVELVSAHVRELLNVRRLQGRLNTRQTAALLNCGEHDVPVLVAKGLLTPLGHPPPNAVKFFAPLEVLELAGDREKMGQICDVIYEHWREKNAARTSATRKARSATSGGSNGALKRNGH
jgi:hypothetical protein